MSFIINTTIGILSKGITNFAKDLGINKENVQIIVKSDEKTGLCYYKCLNFKPLNQVSFKEILGQKIDILNYEGKSLTFMGDTLKKYAEESNAEIENVLVFITLKEEINLVVYINNKYFKTISLINHFKEMGIK